MKIKVGTVALNTTGGNQQVNVGFNPDLFIVYGIARDTDGITQSSRFFWGICDGLNGKVASLRDKDGADPTETSRIWYGDRVINMINNSANTTDYYATVTLKANWSANSFAFNLIDATTGSKRLNYIAVQKANPSDEFDIGTYLMAQDADDELDLGYRPSAFFGASIMAQNGSGSYSDRFETSMGFYDGTTQACTATMSNDDTGETDCFRESSLSQFMMEMDADGNSEGQNHVEFTDDGVNFINDEDFSGQNHMLYIAMKNVVAKVGVVQIPANNGTFNITDIPFIPDLTLFMGIADTSIENIETSHAMLQFGAVDKDGNQNTIGITSENNESSSNSSMYQDDALIWQKTNLAGTTAIDAKIQFNSAVPNLMELQKVLDTDANTQYIFYMAMKSTANLEVERSYPRGIERGITRGVI